MSLLPGVLLEALILGSVYYVVSLGLNLIFGVLEIVNFAQGALVIIGSYITYYLWQATHASPWAMIPIAGIGCGFIGLIIYGAVLIRSKDESIVQMVALIGVAALVVVVLEAIAGSGFVEISDHSPVFRIFKVGFTLDQFVSLGVAVLLGIGITLLLNKTKVGRGIRAMIDDRVALECCGVREGRLGAFAFALGAGLAGIAGGMLSTYLTFGADSGTEFIVIAFTIVVVGGMGDFTGGAVAALGIGVLESAVGTYWNSDYLDVLMVLLATTVLLIQPRGILGRGRLA